MESIRLQRSFISYSQYVNEYSVPDILEAQRNYNEDTNWGHYVDPDTLSNTQKFQLRLKKFWSERDLSFKNYVVQNNTPEWYLQSEPSNNPSEEYENTIYHRILIGVAVIVICIFII